MAWVFLVEKKESTINPKLDFLGAGGLFVSLSCLLLFLNLGGRKGFASPQVLMLGAIAIILFVLFIVQEIRTSQPVVDLGIFKNRLFVGGAITLVIYGLVQAAQLFLFPFYLMDGLRYSASEAGLILAVPPIFFFILAPISGWSSDRIGPRRLCTVGIGLFFAGLFLLARLDDGATTGEIVIRFILLGIGGGIFNAPTTSLLMGAAPNNMLGSVAALANTMRVIAMSCGVAIAGVIFTVRQAFHFSQFAAQNVDPAVINQLSVIGGYRDTIMLAAIVCFMGIFTSALIGRKKGS